MKGTKIRGVIYKYTSPSNKVYIGQTFNEERRKKEFLLSLHYAGQKLENARKKYGAENFKYEILYENYFDNEIDAITDMNAQEIYYIGIYNSINNGYNISIGGNDHLSIMRDEETKKRIIKSLKEYYQTHEPQNKGKKLEEIVGEEKAKEIKELLSFKASSKKGSLNPFYKKTHTDKTKQKMSEKGKERVGAKNSFWGKKHSENTKKIIGEKNGIPVKQIDIKTNEVIAVYPSARNAAVSLGFKSQTGSEIMKVCKKYISPKGKQYLTSHGFKWEYVNNEGSTTIESIDENRINE